MKALFGVLGLLIALAIVGNLTVKQLAAVRQVTSGAGKATGADAAGAGSGGTDLTRVRSPAAALADAASPDLTGGGTVREQAVTMQKQVANDVVNAMNAGAAAHSREADRQGGDKP